MLRPGGRRRWRVRARRKGCFTMPETTEVLDWRGRTAVDSDGDKLGTIEEIYLDAETDRPEWALIQTGLFGGKSSFMPLEGAGERRRRRRAPYEQGDQVKDAPQGRRRRPALRRPRRPSSTATTASSTRVALRRRAPEGAVDRPTGRERGRPRRQRARDRRRDDALRGGAARRHRQARDRPGTAAQVRRHRERDHDGPGPARGGPRSSASRSPTPTATPRLAAAI